MHVLASIFVGVGVGVMLNTAFSSATPHTFNGPGELYGSFVAWSSPDTIRLKTHRPNGSASHVVEVRVDSDTEWFTIVHETTNDVIVREYLTRSGPLGLTPGAPLVASSVTYGPTENRAHIMLIPILQ
ncbi:MAG: hypothetical protein AAB421_05680 [Patescibacteria group bacterium]